MKHGLTPTKLGEILTKSDEWIELKPEGTYRQVTVRLWGKGVKPRGEINGSEIAASKQRVVHARQFIASRIDARNGAFGLIPDSLEGAIVTSDFPVFSLNEARILPEYLHWLSKTKTFVELCKAASEGTTNRVRLKEDRFLTLEIALPSLVEQQRIAARIEQLSTQIEEARRLKEEITKDEQMLLRAAFAGVVKDAQYKLMREVAPLVRRPMEIDPEAEYPELGIRSFGKGTFHKPAVSGFEFGTKRLYCIEPGDLVFMNVFAWEGAVAVAKPEDAGRLGSHRFITCMAKTDIVTADFLCFYFLTEEGLEKLRDASPGGAGRNRTLGLTALGNIEVPVPPMEKQIWFDGLVEQVAALARLQSEAAAELDALLPSILDRVFKDQL